MKYIKTYEKRELKKYVKYKEILYKKYYHKFLFNIEENKVIVYKEFDIINIEFKIWGKIYSRHLDEMSKELGPYMIEPNNGNQMTVHFTEVPEKYLEELDFEIDKDKYNL